jgi:hypothetical protein
MSRVPQSINAGRGTFERNAGRKEPYLQRAYTYGVRRNRPSECITLISLLSNCWRFIGVQDIILRVYWLPLVLKFFYWYCLRFLCKFVYVNPLRKTYFSAHRQSEYRYAYNTKMHEFFDYVEFLSVSIMAQMPPHCFRSQTNNDSVTLITSCVPNFIRGSRWKTKFKSMHRKWKNHTRSEI